MMMPAEKMLEKLAIMKPFTESRKKIPGEKCG
jgi:hypothetical protein